MIYVVVSMTGFHSFSGKDSANAPLIPPFNLPQVIVGMISGENSRNGRSTSIGIATAARRQATSVSRENAKATTSNLIAEAI